MKAVLLAAGVGERLRPFTNLHPKCLVEVGGVSLLHRHLDILASFDAMTGLVIVVGYLEDQIRDAVARWHAQTGRAFEVAFVANEAYQKGSILSLYAAREHLLASDTIVMDADVLYDAEVMARLVRSEHPNCFLIDEAARETGEEMMVCARDGRALHIARSREPSTREGWEIKGEGVGFFRLHQPGAALLIDMMQELIAQGRDDAEYEVALDRFMKEQVCGWEAVGELPWTEIDFADDVARAEREILPRLLRQRATGTGC